jgi:hypothetical protein
MGRFLDDHLWQLLLGGPALLYAFKAAQGTHLGSYYP